MYQICEVCHKLGHISAFWGTKPLSEGLQLPSPKEVRNRLETCPRVMATMSVVSISKGKLVQLRELQK
jgi:hypothetical protein